MTAAAVLLVATLAFPWALPQSGAAAGKAAALLRRVYDEVRTFGTAAPLSASPRQQDFFIGGPDDDDTNKDVHVAVLLYSAAGYEMMKIQVTTLERSLSDPRIKTARGSKAVACRLDGEGVTIISSELGEKDLVRTAKELLTAITDKKRLIKG